MGFQEELKLNIKTKEEAQQNASDKITAIAQYEADRLIKDIRAALIAKAKAADYQSLVHARYLYDIYEKGALIIMLRLLLIIESYFSKIETWSIRLGTCAMLLISMRKNIND